MKTKLLLFVCGITLLIPLIGIGDTDSETEMDFTTECSNNDGECTGDIHPTENGYDGWVLCECYHSADMTSDLEIASGDQFTQTDFDIACESLLDECKSDGNCSFSGSVVFKPISLLSFLF